MTALQWHWQVVSDTWQVASGTGSTSMKLINVIVDVWEGGRTFLTSRAWSMREAFKWRKSEVEIILKIEQIRFGVYAIVSLWINLCLSWLPFSATIYSVLHSGNKRRGQFHTRRKLWIYIFSMNARDQVFFGEKSEVLKLIWKCDLCFLCPPWENVFDETLITEKAG